MGYKNETDVDQADSKAEAIVKVFNSNNEASITVII